MRDPNRINLILDMLKEIWIKYPDLRLCQLITCITKMDDSFYLEDDKFLRLMLEFEVNQNE